MSEQINVEDYEDAFAEFSDEDYKPVDPVDEDPEPEPDLDPEPEPDPEPDPDPDSDLQSQFDILKKENESLQHYKDSNDGRVSALQKKLDEFVAAKPEAEPKNEPTQKPVDDENWKRFSEEDEFTATNIDNRVSQRNEALKDEVLSVLDEKLKPFQANEEKRAAEDKKSYEEHQLGLLDEYDKDWFKTTETKDFNEWVNQQPKVIREMTGSGEAGDYIYLLDGFKRSVGDNNEGETDADKLRRERKDKLANNESVQNRNVGRKAGPPDDFEGAFNYFADKT